MDLDRLLDGAEVDRDLLVELARDHMLKDFAFARRQPAEPLADRLQRGAGLAHDAVAFDRPLDGSQQILLADRLGQEIDRPGLHRPHAAGNVAMAADESDSRWQPAAANAVCSSRPFRPGMARSTTTQPSTAASCWERKSRGERNALT
jgi:hypothetical protein